VKKISEQTPLCQKPLVFEHFKTRGFESSQKSLISEAIRIPSWNSEVYGGVGDFANFYLEYFHSKTKTFININ